MPAVSSPTRARLSFSRSCSSRATTAVRSVNRQMAPWTSDAAPNSGDTLAPSFSVPAGAAGISIERRTLGCPDLRHCAINAATGAACDSMSW